MNNQNHFYGISISFYQIQMIQTKLESFSSNNAFLVLVVEVLGSLSKRAFDTRTDTGRKYFARQDSGVSQIFILIISNGEKIL